jgi:hypothetical protein
MKTKLIAVIALIEIASVSLLLFLLNQEVLPSKTGIILVLLQPITFGLHVTEEFIFPQKNVRLQQKK